MSEQENASGAQVPCISLLACPFCGGDAECYWDSDGYTAGCKNPSCSVQMSPMDGQKKAEVVAAWNRRANAQISGGSALNGGGK